MRLVARLAWLIGALWVAAATPAAAAGAFGDWSAVVVAGDWHAHSGGPSEAFDNARRDVTRAFAVFRAARAVSRGQPDQVRASGDL
jgi:hypothetical protein